MGYTDMYAQGTSTNFSLLSFAIAHPIITLILAVIIFKLVKHFISGLGRTLNTIFADIKKDIKQKSDARIDAMSKKITNKYFSAKKKYCAAKKKCYAAINRFKIAIKNATIMKVQSK